MQHSYDVIVAGAGISGFAAAIGARQAGASVLLLDKRPSAGGTAVYALTPVLSGWPYPQRGGGVADMLKNYLEQRNQLIWRNDNGNTEEDALQAAMMDMLQSAGVEMLFDAELIKAAAADRRIASITVKHGGEELAVYRRAHRSGEGLRLHHHLCGLRLRCKPGVLRRHPALQGRIRQQLHL